MANETEKKLIGFVIHGPPVGKERARKGKWGKWYTPKKTRDYESQIRTSGIVARHNAGLPAEPSKEKFLLHYEIYHPKRRGRYPDADNVEKSIMDGLQGVFWVDDGQVTPRCRLVEKHAISPRVVVEIEKL